MKAIDVEGLPDPIIRSLESMVRTFREEIGKVEEPRDNAGRSSKRVELLAKKGDVIGPLTREKIYEDVTSSSSHLR